VLKNTHPVLYCLLISFAEYIMLNSSLFFNTCQVIEDNISARANGHIPNRPEAKPHRYESLG
jgi:hypothetical protein